MSKLTESKPRDATIRKSNELIQRYHFDLSLQQQKIILFLISKIQPWDEDFKQYELTIADFSRIYGIKTGGKSFAELENAIKSLADLSYWKTFPDSKRKLLRWIETPEIDELNEIITIRFDPNMKPFLLQLKENFTRYELWNILLFKSRYSIRLYELVKSLHYHELEVYEKEYTVDELKKAMGGEIYSKIYDFKRKALFPATNEINEYSDQKITVIEIHKGKRQIVGFKLRIETKELCDIMECRKRVEYELGAEQLSLWDKMTAEPKQEEYIYTLS